VGAGVLKAKVGGQWVPIIGSGMSAEVARWNSAWGVVAKGTSTSSASGIGADTTIISVTATLVAGRRYRLAGTLQVGSSTANAIQFAKITDNALTQLSVDNEISTTVNTLEPVAYVEPVVSGPVTYLLRASSTQTFALNGASFQPHVFTVEDVGPVIYNAAPAPIGTPTAWTNATLQNSWVNVSSSTFTSARYRLNGDRVEVEGLVGGGAYSVAIFTLPAGYRPSKNFVFTCFGSGANGAVGAFRVDVQPDGTVLVQAAAAGTTGPPSYMTLTGIQFSITP